MSRQEHSHRCGGELVTGPCTARIECRGPLERTEDGGGYCAGDDETMWCEDCRALVEAGQRCDGCSLIDESVVPDGDDRACPACLGLVDAAA